MPFSADTMVRIVRTVGPRMRPASRILSVDDWAWRKGKRYGTVLMAPETNKAVDFWGFHNQHLQVDAGALPFGQTVMR